MTKTWYPIVNYLNCIECGACIKKCPNGVYDYLNAYSPLIKNPEACIDHCHGCGSLCPAGAITYMGEDTGWTPNHKAEKTGCSCGCGEVSKNKVLVEYLYLDLQTCDRCIGTDNVLDEVMTAIAPALRLAGYEVEYNKIKIETEELAKKYKFLSSPTIRINGQDICVSVKENNCGCCSEISGTNVACRIFEYNGNTYEVAPKEMLAKAIFKSVFEASEGYCSCSEYQLPTNLKKFFDGKKNKTCSCSGNCC